MPVSFQPTHRPAPPALPAPRVAGRPLNIGALAFNKHIATELTTRIAQVSADSLVAGSPEQLAIWDALINGTSHLIIDAKAGTGKTFTIVQGILRLLLEYGGRVTATTYNSYGWRACRKAFRPELDDMKVGRIINELVTPMDLSYDSRQEVITGTRRLVSLCMNYLLAGTDALQLDAIADKHNVTLNGSAAKVFALVPQVLELCAAQTSVMSFDDQVWQTVTKRLPVEQFDMLFSDESQDSALVQQEMIMLACPRGRIIFAGDNRQAIYGFRAADTDSMARMQERLAATERGVVVLPLTVTRRCPKSHVRLAQAIVPDIQAMPDAPEGEVAAMPTTDAVKAMRPGDLVLCRTNGPLVPIAYALIQANIKAVIRGRDIGVNLRQLVDKLRAGDSVPKLLEKLDAYRTAEMGKLVRLGERGASKMQSLVDRCDCVTALTQGVNSVTALKAKIDRIFADFESDGTPKDAVVLGSIHRTKGLEGHTVYILEPGLLPHPMAKQAWEQIQESNCAYIAITRAKYDPRDPVAHPGRVVFVNGSVPPIYISGRGRGRA